MKTIKVAITFIEEILGTECADKDVHKEFIASKSKDAAKMEEELAALSADELVDKAVTVFARDTECVPMLWDYQIKGFFKDAIGLLLELEPKQINVGKSKLSKWTVKRLLDNYLFITPRRVRFSDTSQVGICTRPLRAQTMRGERIALASSETMPAGSVITFEITMMDDGLETLVRAALEYGKLKGIGQWRNSGKGRFEFKEIVE